MKRILFYLTALTIFMTACSDSQEAEITENKSSAKKVSAESSAVVDEETTKEKNEVVEAKEAPARTIEMDNPPWQQYSTQYLNDFIREGETVFEFDDAVLLEQHIERDVTRDYLHEWERDESAVVFAKVVGMYVEEVEEYYPDKEEYFDKMQEVRTELREGNYDEVLELIEEARTLRES